MATEGLTPKHLEVAQEHILDQAAVAEDITNQMQLVAMEPAA